MELLKRKTGNREPVKDAVARKIANGIISLQLKIAGLLQRQERRCSARQKKLLLLLFCLVTGGYCLYLLGNGLLGYREKNNAPAIRMNMLPGAQPPPPVLPDSTNFTG